MQTLKLLFALLLISGLGFHSFPQNENDTLLTAIEEECDSDSTDSFDFDFYWEKETMDFGFN